MRKIFLGFIAMLILSLALVSCASSIETVMYENSDSSIPTETAEQPDVTPATTPETPVTEPEQGETNEIHTSFIYHATVQYGEADLISEDYDGLMLTYIRFPQANGFADQYIKDWAYEIRNQSYDIIEALRETDDSAIGEVNIQFDSYLVNDRFVGISQHGMFMNNALAHPIDIIQSFNLDLSREVFLNNSDILDFNKSADIITLLSEKILIVNPDTDGLLEDIDESWLTFPVITPDGVLVILKRGDYLPTYMGSLKVLLPYDELGSLLLLGKEQEPEPHHN